MPEATAGSENASSAHSPQQKTGRGNKKPIVSRRALFTGGAAAAASLVVGVGGGAIVAQRMMEPPKPWWPKLVEGKPVTWHQVAPLADVGEDAIKFVTDSVIGYVILNDDDHEVIAFSAACTHMGCIVQWNGNARRFDCPCHNGRFTEYGDPDPGGTVKYLVSLPRLDVRIADDHVYVAVPKLTTT
jgi:Rieske Fe-S protein